MCRIRNGHRHVLFPQLCQADGILSHWFAEILREHPVDTIQRRCDNLYIFQGLGTPVPAAKQTYLSQWEYEQKLSKYPLQFREI